MRVDNLIKYINSLTKSEQISFAERCDTSVGYLRKAAYTRQRISGDLCINIERESKRAIRCEDLRPDVDWASIRNTRESD